jgi:hypothetical protein
MCHAYRFMRFVIMPNSSGRLVSLLEERDPRGDRMMAYQRK